MLNELPSASDALAGDGSDPDHDSEGSDAESDDGIGDDSEDEEEPEMAANMDALSLLELRQCCDQKCLEKLASDPLTKNSFKMSVECLKKLLSLQGYSRHVALLAFRSKFVAVTNRWPQNPSEHFLPRGLNYFYDSERKICRSAYAALLGCSAFRLTRIIKYVKEFKISRLSAAGNQHSRQHKLKQWEVDFLAVFLDNFAERHGLPNPGGDRIFLNDKGEITDLIHMLLPASVSKRKVYKQYCDAFNAPFVAPTTTLNMSTNNSSNNNNNNVATRRLRNTDGYYSVSWPKFLELWKRHRPNISIVGPRSDLCDTCTLLRTSYFNSKAQSNRNVDDPVLQRLAINKMFKEHQDIQESCRELYKDTVQQCQRDGIPFASFDFAQNVSYPFSAEQVGSIYFKTPTKVTVFGFGWEHLSDQENFYYYIVDESQMIEKGPNAVISLVHDAFERYEQKFGANSLKKLKVIFDNCRGQNANRWVVYYFAWRIAMKKSSEITVHRLIPGHTKFFPDRYFGVFKAAYRRGRYDNLQDVVDLANQCCVRARARLVPTWFDWKAYFVSTDYKAPVGHGDWRLTLFKADGTLWFSKDVRTPLEEYKNFKKATCRFHPTFRLFPTRLMCEGMKPERLDYLYKEIALCPEYFADPAKAMPKPAGYEEREAAKRRQVREGTLKRRAEGDQYDKMSKQELTTEAKKMNIDTRAFNKEKAHAVLLAEVKNKARTNPQEAMAYEDMSDG